CTPPGAEGCAGGLAESPVIVCSCAPGSCARRRARPGSTTFSTSSSLILPVRVRSRIRPYPSRGFG
ncbi:MAG: hypothetical protein AVDCRST_MAG01-01-2972, partial [uncultured Rubrobacteraceae bacterium]